MDKNYLLYGKKYPFLLESKLSQQTYICEPTIYGEVPLNSQNLTAYQTLDPYNVAVCHNAILSVMYAATYSSKGLLTIEGILKGISELLHPLKLSLPQSQYQLIFNLARVNLTRLSSAPSPNDEVLNMLFEALRSLNCSNHLISSFSELRKFENHSKNTQEFIGWVHETLEPFNSGIDGEVSKIFTQLVLASDNFWHHSYVTNTARLKPSTWVIIHDGIGGVVGTIFGGIGSVVCATAFSAYTNETLG
jgi:hypothetical protein